MECIFSIDVEDWFHILDLPSTPDISRWGSLASWVEKNFLRLLDLCDERQVAATCFFLGWVAERFPHLVKEAEQRGHEVASHGYAHRLVYEMGEKDFFEDAVKSRLILEDLTGHAVAGYRSSGFSVTKQTPWFFDALIQAGYRYDSSLFPAKRSHGGIEGGSYAPYRLARNAENLIEFPITVTPVLGRRWCFFGGGYLRLSPGFVIRRMARRVLAEGRPVIFYVHPREIDPDHPRLPMSFGRSFKSYVNLKGTEAKIGAILGEFRFQTFARFIAERGLEIEQRNDHPGEGVIHAGRECRLEQSGGSGPPAESS
ncbi:MAG TPA: XrtA system polysaccharide deacetylase [Terriglobia bacterium]